MQGQGIANAMQNGVLAFAIARRSRELAVRVAVGATARDLLTLVVGDGMRLLCAGTLLGVVATFALTRLAQGRGGIFESPGWQAFGVPIAMILAIGVVATWIPSRHALRINPAVLLRTD